MATQNFIMQHIKKSKVTIIAGRPSTGKTTLAVSICIGHAKNKEKSILFSLEESKEQIYRHFINDKEPQYSENWIKIDDTKNLSINYLRSQIELTQASLVIIDYIQLMSSAPKELKRIISDLTLIARDKNISIILLSQISRLAEENPEPSAKDLLFLNECDFDDIDIVFINKNVMESIALVSPSDSITGYAPKLLVHQQGMLHRAFSIVVFNDKGEMLLQKRAATKYHSGGLWTNTCCSHPVEGKEMETYMHERLQHEMGFDCELKFAFSFHYTAKFDNGLTENEIDHVYTGKWNGTPLPDPNEADDYRWARPESMISEIKLHPEMFTVWFKEIMERMEI